ncbi:MFS general substrate transporter [Aaosphaeria arxii CBS 175.79]|uniref:MFS general substrate transporter n=1 Tax=Aaosphaeria arxii CBS 175.79 TaxID=1450172 RepID=A0A6A5XPM2_9PLEO|nr:MFS general substrate transporter [Aaosphaeria arxii CBS 175.79]KAF2015198.1 MFS general substrate transporter [Aaosphaeria arxii CBS 175.79]
MSDETFLDTEKTLVRKLDRTLMPVVFILYLFNYLDRNNIAQAKLDSFEADLGLTGNNYSTAVSILVPGYMLMQLPSNMILTRVRPSLYIPFWVCLWSCVSASTAAVHNFQGLIAVRFILGITEAPFFPGVFYLLSCWYRKGELALRFAILYSGLVLATAVSGLLAAGIFSGLDGVAGLAGWRWLFIIEGAVSFLLGLIAFFFLPDFPGSATGSARWLLSEEERRISSYRMSLDSISSQETNRSVRHGLKLALCDYKVWIFSLILCSNQTAYGFNYFFPSIVRGFNLGSRTITLVCTAPPYIIGAVVSYFIAWSSDRKYERGYHICAPLAFAVVGFTLSVSILNIVARYCASFIYISGVFGANAAVYSWAAFTVGDTSEKKAAATAIINIMGQFGNIWSPYFFDPNDEPRYSRAMILLIAFCGLEIALSLTMKAILRRENKKILARTEVSGNLPGLYML